MKPSPPPYTSAIAALAALIWLTPSATQAQGFDNSDSSDALSRIEEQGLTTNSQAMATLSYLSDVIAAGSPARNLKHANEWTRRSWKNGV